MIAFRHDAMTAAGFALMMLAGSEWGAFGNDQQYIQFREGRAAGHSGCNRYTGSYAQSGAKLRFGAVASTRMACDEQRMARERRWFRMLERTRSFTASNRLLTLRDGLGRIIAKLKRRDID
jgi:heat shock protein HslJ